MWKSGITVIMGMMGKDVSVSLPPVEFREEGNYGNFGYRCRCVGPPLLNIGIPGNMGIRLSDDISLCAYPLYISRFTGIV